MKSFRTKLIVSGICLIVAFVMLVLITFAWFVVPSPFSNGIALSSSEAPRLQISTSTNGEDFEESTGLNFSGLICGMRRSFFIKIHSFYGAPLPITLYIDAPSGTHGAETPIFVADEGSVEYYYLGSQIRICEILVYDNENVLASGARTPSLPIFLVETQAIGGAQVSFVQNPITSFVSITLVTSYSLNSNSDMIVFVEFEFVDNGQNQNAYQSFSSNGGACSRRISAVISNGE